MSDEQAAGVRKVALRAAAKQAVEKPEFLLPRPEIPLHIGLTFGIYSLRPTLPRAGLAPGNRIEVAACEFSGVGEPEHCSVEHAENQARRA